MTLPSSKFESTTTVGKGKNKKDIVEVVFAYNVVVDTQQGANDGSNEQYLFNTGSSIDNPYGLMLRRMEMSISQRDATDFQTAVAANMYVTDDLADDFGYYGVDERLHKVDNVLSRPRFVFVTNVGQVLQSVRNYTSEDFRKIFVGNELALNTSQTVSAGTGEASGTEIIFLHKYVFEKVKLTKNEYLETLATRVCR